MNSRIKPNCAVAQDLTMLREEVEKMKQEKPRKTRKPRPEWSKRGTR